MPIEHLPESLKPAARRVRDWVATDKGQLLILFLIFCVRTSAYLFMDPWLARHVLEQRARLLLPQHVLDVEMPWVSITMWVVATLLLGVAVVVRSNAVETVALTVAVAVLAVWGALFFWTGPAMFCSRGVFYVGLAVQSGYTVWRGNSATIRVEGDRYAAAGFAGRV